MSIAEFALKKRLIVIVLTVVMAVAGVFAFEKLGRLEDPEFTIKEAKVTTIYPGARPVEVEQEVTDTLETAIQQLGQLKRITSTTKEGMSIITPEIKDSYDKSTLPQVWDELRRKVNDAQSQLPPGTQHSIVNDDFGDVFGIFFAVTGDGYTYQELKDFVDSLRRELLLVEGVSKIDLWGVQKETVFIEISQAKMAQLNISPNEIFNTLENQNIVVPAGNVRVGDEYIAIVPTGGFTSINQIGALLIKSKDKNNLIYLRDIAKIYRGYETPPKQLMRYNNKPAIGVGVSVASGGNVVKLGEKVEQKIRDMKAFIPVGMHIDKIFFQADEVTKAINGFMVSLIQALAIVIVILLYFMGVRSGLLIGGILLLNILGTFVFMQMMAIDLQRISLGALIIALGMLVDNAIVVTDSILVKIQQGVDKTKTAIDSVNKTMFPLLGATLIGVLAFAAISMSQDSTGEYTRSLFQVIFISLMLSWVLAVTVTPLLCVMILKPDNIDDNRDPYKGFIYTGYANFLKLAIKWRYISLGIILGLFAISMIGFKYVDKTFFPNSTLPLFMVDYWRPQGSDLRATERDVKKIEAYVKTLDGIDNVSSFIGGGATRFTLIYAPEEPDNNYAQLLISVKDFSKINEYIPKIRKYIQDNFLNSEFKVKKFRMGTGSGALIKARISGKDPNVLRALASQATNIMHDNGNAIDIKTDWGHRVNILQPVYAESRARELGISRAKVSASLEAASSGINVGVYRELNKLLPIILRPIDKERNVADLYNIPIWSPVAEQYIPIGQVVKKFDTKWEDPILKRRNRTLTLTVECDPNTGTASALLQQIMPKINAIKMPPGYRLEWGGEYEDSADAQAGLSKNLPTVIIGMILISILLFNALRQPFIIWVCVPFALIGVTIGLLITHQPFGFMALLGFLSLSGMLIKNAIVLVDEMDSQIKEGLEPYTAVIQSSLSRMRPVLMAALTTILGMIPLLKDVFFVSMSVTIMFGLAFATLLTLVLVPLLYCVLFKIKD